jgi:hypothetical protein
MKIGTSGASLYSSKKLEYQRGEICEKDNVSILD